MKTAAQPEPLILSAAKFKALCLRLMDEANATQRPITVTKRGKPVGQFVPMPVEKKPFRSIVGRSPGITIPSPGEWKKTKAEWAEEWDDSAEKLAQQMTPAKTKKHGKK